MRRKSLIHLTLVFMTIMLSSVHVSSPAATIYGPKKFTRGTGKPVVVTETFSLQSVTNPYRLIVWNGENGNNRVSSATLKINGVEILKESDFNQKVDKIEKDITLQASNSVSVELNSAPGSFITVSITTSEGQNHPPSAQNQSVATNEDTAKAVVLVATDPDGDTLTYSIVIQPTHGALSGALPNAIYTPIARYYGPDSFTFKANDGKLDSNIATVSITVNSPPTAHAGPDQTVHTGDTVRLDGSKSTDLDGNLLTFQWSFTSVPAESHAILSDSKAVNPTFVVDREGAYVIQLIVNDGRADSLPDRVTISTTNSRAVARAGPDQTVHVGDTVQLDGSQSTDVDGDLLSYRWAFISVPAGSSVVLSNPSLIRPSFTVDKAGTYMIQLIVNDGQLDSLPDGVTISTTNSRPVAHAGEDQTVYIGDTVQLDGSLSADVDGDLLSYLWAFVSMPAGSSVVLSNPSSIRPSFTVDKAGTYVIQLIVSGGQLDSFPDTVVVSTLNSRPVANAGPDQTVYVGDEVHLDGSASGDADKGSLSFFWSILSKPDQSTAVLDSSMVVKPMFTPDLLGSYVAQLIVDDGKLESFPDTTTITANLRMVTVPNVVSMTQANAESAITEAKLALGTITRENSDAVPAGSVISQSPQAGASVAQGSSVSLVISLGILMKSQTIDFAPLFNKTFGDADFSVNATASSGLAVSFTATGSCTVLGNSVHITGAGSCTVTAHQGGTSNWNPAPDVPQSFTIAKANQTIGFMPLTDKSYDAPPFAVGATASSTLVVDFDSQTPPVCSVSGTLVTLLDVGTCTVRASQGGDSNYNAAMPVDQSFKVTPGVLHHFAIESIRSPQTAGAAFSITITAKDRGDHTVIGFNGTVEITSTGTLSSGEGKSEAFTNGVLASHKVTISKTGIFAITATRTGGTENGTSNNFTVNPGALSNFLVEAEGGGSIAPQTAGTPFSIRITARDQNNNTVMDFTGTVRITSSGDFSGAPLTSDVFVSGVLTSQSVTITSAQVATTLSATDSASGANGTSNGFTVNPGGLGNFLVEASTGGNIGPQTAGTSFGIKITARDSYNNVIPTFSGQVTLEAEVGPISPVSVIFYGNEGGFLTVDVILSRAATPQTVTAMSGGHQGTSNDFTVNPGGLGSFLVEASAGGEIDPQTAGIPFGIKVTARDSSNNVITTFSGAVALSTNARSITPSTVTFTGTEGGVLATNVTLAQSGLNKTITATSGIRSGQSNPFTVNAGPLDHFKIEAADGGDISGQMAWVSFSIQITARDSQSNIVPSFNETVNLTSTGILASGGGTTGAFSNGLLASHSVMISSGGSFTIEATRTGGAEIGTSNAFTVNNPAPALSSMNPVAVTAESPSFTLALNGDNFLTTSTVSFNNEQVSSQYISKTQLQATIPSTAVATAGSYPVKVTNPAPGGGITRELALSVLNPVPSVSSIDPTSITAGSPGFTLTLKGDNFITTSSVSFNGQPVPSQHVSKTQIRATIPSVAITTPGNYPVKVINPAPGGGETLALTFTVTSVLEIAITSPSDGETMNRAKTMVKGTITSATRDVGVTVNGIVAEITANNWIVNHIPLAIGSNPITAVATDFSGNTVLRSITVTTNINAQFVTLSADVTSGISPLQVRFSVSTSGIAPALYQMDFDGDGVFDYNGVTFDNVSYTYPSEGIYSPRIVISDPQGNTHSDMISITVFSKAEVDTLLRGKWEGMRAKLITGDIDGALGFFDEFTKQDYRELFNALSAMLPTIAQEMSDIQLIEYLGETAIYDIRTRRDNKEYSFQLLFNKDFNGIWKITSF